MNMQNPDYITAMECLSFVKSLKGSTGGRNYWAIPDVGYALGWPFGEGLALEALRYVNQWETDGPGFPYLLPNVIQSMIKRGIFGGTELSFMRVIGQAAKDGTAGRLKVSSRVALIESLVAAAETRSATA